MTANKHYFRADDNGKVVGSYYVDDATHAELLRSGLALREGHADLERHYVEDGRLTERPAFPCALEGKRIVNLVEPCVISINGVDYDCDDTEVELAFARPGYYRLRVIPPWPYLMKEYTIEENSAP